MPTSLEPAAATIARKKPIHRQGEHAHAVATARGILIGRVDAMLPDLVKIIQGVAGDSLDSDERETLAIKVIQALQVRLFPEEFTGRGSVPSPSGRLGKPAGLFPRVFTQAEEYARHLLAEGQRSPAAGLTMPDGTPVFDVGDLTRLGERLARRAGRASGAG